MKMVRVNRMERVLRAFRQQLNIVVHAIGVTFEDELQQAVHSNQANMLYVGARSFVMRCKDG